MDKASPHGMDRLISARSTWTPWPAGHPGEAMDAGYPQSIDGRLRRQGIVVHVATTLVNVLLMHADTEPSTRSTALLL